MRMVNVVVTEIKSQLSHTMFTRLAEEKKAKRECVYNHFKTISLAK